jgi:hypothetical protein
VSAYALLEVDSSPPEPIWVAVGIVVMAIVLIAPIVLVAWAGTIRARRSLAAWAAREGLTLERVKRCSAWGAQRGPFNGTGAWMNVFFITARNSRGETRGAYVGFGNFLVFGSFQPDVRW